MWETKERDLISEVEELETNVRTKQLQTAEYIDDVKLMREEITELVSSIETKETKLVELEAKVATLPSSINRYAVCTINDIDSHEKVNLSFFSAIKY